MKKNYFIILSLLSFSFGFSQVLFEDDFDGSGPGLAGWTLNNLDGLAPNAAVAEFTDAWIERDDYDNTGDIVAASTSWYTPAGASDDWMITPAINLTGNATLTWDEEAQDPNFPDGYEVLLSTTGTSVPGDFTNVLYTTAAASGGVWTTQSADLSAYTGETVYIAWRNNSTDQFVLMINNVKVEVNLDYDIAVNPSPEAYQQYTQIPVDQSQSMGTNAIIENLGDLAVTNVVLTLNVLDETMTSVYTESSASIPSIASGASETINFTGFTPTIEGIYTIEQTVTIAEIDQDLSNDTLTETINITAATYARDNDIITGSLGIGADNGGYLGQQFEIINTQNIVSGTCVIRNTNGTLTGATTVLSVWDMVGGVPNAIIAETDPITITAVADETYTANIAGGPFSLSPGQYVVTIEEPTTGNVTVATTTDIFTSGTTWVDWATNPNGAWSNNEDFGFNVSYMIRPNFEPLPLSTEDFDVISKSIHLYPNPASDSVIIRNTNELHLIQANIYDLTGRLMASYDLSNMGLTKTIDVSSLQSANYFVSIQSNNSTITKKLIIK